MTITLPLDTPKLEQPRLLHDRLPLDRAKNATIALQSAVSTAVQTIRLAGSARRLKPTVKDIEFVCIERHKGALLDALRNYMSRHKRILDVYVPTRGEKQVCVLEPVTLNGATYHLKVEFYISQPEYFGYTFALRTGSADFNKAVMARFRELGYIVDNNRFIKGDRILQAQTEERFFEILGAAFIEPHLRHDKFSLQAAIRNAAK